MRNDLKMKCVSCCFSDALRLNLIGAETCSSRTNLPLQSLLFAADSKNAVLYDHHVCLKVKHQPGEEPFER